MLRLADALSDAFFDSLLTDTDRLIESDCDRLCDCE